MMMMAVTLILMELIMMDSMLNQGIRGTFAQTALQLILTKERSASWVSDKEAKALRLSSCCKTVKLQSWDLTPVASGFRVKPLTPHRMAQLP